MLPVFERGTIEDGKRYVERVTIERNNWPTEATWAFLEAFLDAKRRTLERYVSVAPRRPRKARRRR